MFFNLNITLNTGNISCELYYITWNQEMNRPRMSSYPRVILLLLK